MWWKPENDYERILESDIKRLGIWFKEQRTEVSIASGYGSVYLPELEMLVPLVVLNTDFLESWVCGESELLWTESELRYTSSYIPSLPDDFLSRLPKLNLELPLHFVVASRPRPAFIRDLADKIFDGYLPMRRPLVCEISNKSGTAGVSVLDKSTGKLGILTAGHVFDRGLYSRVGILKGSLFWKRITHFGSVSHFIVPPKNGVGWDAAVVEPDKSNSKFTFHLRTHGLVKRFDNHESVIVYGAQSGVITEARVLAGALNTIEHWNNCWMLAPSGVLKDGDSGAAVFTKNDGGKYLGTYVGCSVFKGSRKPYIHYVQDAFTLRSEVLKNWDIEYY